MNIDLGNGYRLGADSRQWIIQKKAMRKNKKTGVIEECWDNMTYHGTPTQAVNFHADRLLRASDANTLGEALKECNRITTELTDALTIHIQVKEEVK
jgi:hypothetical protein